MELLSIGFYKKQPEATCLTQTNRREATNRRRHMRYPVRASIEYSWQNKEGFLLQESGWTRNVSEDGALVVSANCPEVGDLVEFTMRVSGKKRASGSPTFSVSMRGEAVRVSSNSSTGTPTEFAIWTRIGDRQRVEDQENLVPRRENSGDTRLN
jgi:hypothetical protein